MSYEGKGRWAGRQNEKGMLQMAGTCLSLQKLIGLLFFRYVFRCGWKTVLLELAAYTDEGKALLADTQLKETAEIG